MAVIVSTDKGQIAGVDKTGIVEFLGIPFAKPPVGPLRFCAPQPCDAWSGVYEASKYGPSAPQSQGLPGHDPVRPF